MDREQNELQSLRFLGVYRETSKIILKWKKIFAQITLALLLPLCVIYLTHSLVSQLLSLKILDHETTRKYTWADDPNYRKLSRILERERVTFWLVGLGYLVLAFIFSLLSTSAVVHTVACVYTTKQITFNKIMSVVPRVWKRLIVTFFWSLAVFVVYHAVAVGVLIVGLIIMKKSSVRSPLAIAMGAIFLILYIIWLIYITMICQMASVMSVLEDVRGLKAMAKSKRLMKGKMCLSVWCFLGVLVCAVLVQALVECLVVFNFVGMGVKVGVGLICLLLLLMVALFDLVLQTVIYFVCKSHHHENIDISSLCDHAEVSPGDCPSLGQETA